MAFLVDWEREKKLTAAGLDIILQCEQKDLGHIVLFQHHIEICDGFL
jgi:hypothetical protein